jgi:hypothetical protein
MGTPAGNCSVEVSAPNIIAVTLHQTLDDKRRNARREDAGTDRGREEEPIVHAALAVCEERDANLASVVISDFDAPLSGPNFKPSSR